MTGFVDQRRLYDEKCRYVNPKAELQPWTEVEVFQKILLGFIWTSHNGIWYSLGKIDEKLQGLKRCTDEWETFHPSS